MIPRCVICSNTYSGRYICPSCQKINNKYGIEWKHPSDEEWPEEHIETIASPVRLEAIQGGRRRFDSEIADKIVQVSRVLVPRRRRRRNQKGSPLRGWEDVMVPPSYRDIARAVGCSKSFVERVIRRMRG